MLVIEDIDFENLKVTEFSDDSNLYYDTNYTKCIITISFDFDILMLSTDDLNILYSILNHLLSNGFKVYWNANSTYEIGKVKSRVYGYVMW